MIAVSFTTKRAQREILDRAVEYFADDVGLELTERTDCCVYFGGKDQVGYVKVMLSQKGEEFEVDVESREYEYHAKKFVSKFK
jgi:hypothetical protein